MKQLQTALKLTVLLMALAFMAVGCQKDDEAYEDHPTSKSPQGFTVRNLSLADIQQKQNIQQALGKLQKTFDVNKQKNHTERSGTDAKIDAGDGSFTLLTERIIEVATDSSVTYAFLLETPTDTASEFENFVLEVRHDTLINYHFLKYRFLEESTEDFPYAINLQVVSPDLVSLDDLYSQTNKMVQIGNVCVNMVCITSPRDFDCNWVIESVFDCPSGPGGGNTGGTGSGDGGTGSGSGGSGDGGTGTGTGGNAGTGGTGTGNTGDGGPDDGSETPVLGVNEPKDNNLCNFFKDLTTNESVNAIIELYKESTDIETEVGILLSEQPDGSYNAIAGTVPDEEYAVQFDVPDGYTPLHFMVHTHNTGGLSIFSPQDFEQIYQLMVNEEVSINNPFVSILVTEDDVYAMSFTNPQTFLNFGNMWFNDPIKFKLFEGRFFDSKNRQKYITYGINGSNDNATNEQHFLEMIKHQNMGFMVHKANEDLSQWDRLSINLFTGNIQSIPCN